MYVVEESADPSTQQGSVVVIDALTNTTIGSPKIAVGKVPLGMALAKDFKSVYVVTTTIEPLYVIDADQ